MLMLPGMPSPSQLRIHAASLGTPIVGDDLYWESAAAARIARGDLHPLPPIRKGGGLFLQSCAVAFDHPASDPCLERHSDSPIEAGDAGRGHDVRVEIEADAKFGALLDRARRGWDYTYNSS